MTERSQIGKPQWLENSELLSEINHSEFSGWCRVEHLQNNDRVRRKAQKNWRETF